MEQHYSEEDDRQHIKSLIPYFKDPRYIKIDNKPVFNIYRCELLPNLKNTIKIWREEAYKEGIELYLCNFEFYGAQAALNLFDSNIEFQPFSSYLNQFTNERKNIKSQRYILKDLWIRIIYKFSSKSVTNSKCFYKQTELSRLC